MGRREFLTRTAGLAGLAGLASVLPAETLISEAANVQTRAAFPSSSNIPVDTFVVLMMENRSFDHYLGWFPRADGRNRGLRYPDDAGKKHATHKLAPDYQGCGFMDPDHSFEGGRAEYNHGRLDGFYVANDDYAIGYYEKADLGFLPQAAKEFTMYDRYFCSLLGPTFPNRHYMWGAQSGGQTTNVIPADELGDKWETIFDRAIAKGFAARYLQLRPAVRRAVRHARHPVDPSHRGLPSGLCGRHPAEHRVRRSAVPGRRRRRRPLGRRAPARRHPHRPGLHGAAHARVPELAAVPDRRDVHQLRPVGRLLRPCAAPVRPRLPPEQEALEDVRTHGLPNPGGGDFAVRPPRARQSRNGHARVDPEADFAPVRAGISEQAPQVRVADRPHLRLGTPEVRGPRPSQPVAPCDDTVLAPIVVELRSRGRGGE